METTQEDENEDEGEHDGDEDGGEEDEGEEDEGEEDENEEGEPEADGEDEAVLEQLRAQAKPVEPRSRLAKDRGFICWDNAQRTAFFPLILTEAHTTYTHAYMHARTHTHHAC